MSQDEFFRIKTLNNIAQVGLSNLPKARYVHGANIEEPHAILVRSANLIEFEPSSSLLAVGRAGAGTNNIDIFRLAALGVPVFNTPGANANAVKELVLSGLLLSSRNLIGAIDFVSNLTLDGQLSKNIEEGKKKYAGRELPGRTLGIIGLGKIGSLVADVAMKLGMRVVGYDPGITVDAAWSLPGGVIKAASIESLVRDSDFISLHVPLNDATKNLVDDKCLALMSADTVLLNFSRGAVVDNDALVAALTGKKIKQYICDFPNESLIDVDGVIALPHLGASTVEAEENCATMVVDQIRGYLEHGNVVNAVNFPNVLMPRESPFRIVVINENVPHMVSQISTVLGDAKLNIHNMINKSLNEIAITLVDVNHSVGDDVLNTIKNIKGVQRVRYLNEV
ncbi:3-phosphoglycerate dehydrogenase family protein [Burkholderiales bacterium]|nr:3-phosphoglycerate dehydrogenase family protein [Burkholderiales bacterium]